MIAGALLAPAPAPSASGAKGPSSEEPGGHAFATVLAGAEGDAPPPTDVVGPLGDEAAPDEAPKDPDAAWLALAAAFWLGPPPSLPGPPAVGEEAEPADAADPGASADAKGGAAVPAFAPTAPGPTTNVSEGPPSVPAESGVFAVAVASGDAEIAPRSSPIAQKAVDLARARAGVASMTPTTKPLTPATPSAAGPTMATVGPLAPGLPGSPAPSVVAARAATSRVSRTAARPSAPSAPRPSAPSAAMPSAPSAAATQALSSATAAVQASSPGVAQPPLGAPSPGTPAPGTPAPASPGAGASTASAGAQGAVRGPSAKRPPAMPPELRLVGAGTGPAADPALTVEGLLGRPPRDEEHDDEASLPRFEGKPTLEAEPKTAGGSPPPKVAAAHPGDAHALARAARNEAFVHASSVMSLRRGASGELRLPELGLVSVSATAHAHGAVAVQVDAARPTTAALLVEHHAAMTATVREVAGGAEVHVGQHAFGERPKNPHEAPGEEAGPAPRKVAGVARKSRFVL